MFYREITSLKSLFQDALLVLVTTELLGIIFLLGVHHT